MRKVWGHGHSDYSPIKPTTFELKEKDDSQPPVQTLSWAYWYVMKYTLKNTTARTLRAKMFPKDDGKGSKKDIGAIKDTGTTAVGTRLLELCKQYKIKQVSWSRGFDFPNKTVSSNGQTLFDSSSRPEGTPSNGQTSLV